MSQCSALISMLLTLSIESAFHLSGTFEIFKDYVCPSSLPKILTIRVLSGFLPILCII